MIKTALLSVSDKTDIVPFAQFLHRQGVHILSTGGTAQALKAAGVPITEVAEHTGFPEIMDGRVKTLHPTIHGGILARRDVPDHQEAMHTHHIAAIDLVAINLYPFEETIAKGAEPELCIENIDIGGPAMIRSAAKNHAHVTVITDPEDYALVQEEMQNEGGTTTQTTRQMLACKAFSRTAAYDAAIARWTASQFKVDFPKYYTQAGVLRMPLHYGENPHQQAALYITEATTPSVANGDVVHGERLSYNNLNDANAAFELVAEFTDPTVAIIKHANPCGVASADSIKEAFGAALACDATSAYGGIIAINREIDVPLCEAISAAKLFVEVLVAPSVTDAALALLQKRKKLRVVITGGMPKPDQAAPQLTTLSGGFLLQDKDNAVFKDPAYTLVTEKQADNTTIEDMLFAYRVAKHVKSNAIVLVKNKATIGIGAGQMSRIDSTQLAVKKAANAHLSVNGATLASDAFFPFPDNVEIAAEAGIAAIIQPGGSIRDNEVIEAANRHQLSMVFTQMRHFKH